MIDFEPRLDWKNVSEGEPETVVYKEDLLRYENAIKDLTDLVNEGLLSPQSLFSTFVQIARNPTIENIDLVSGPVDFNDLSGPGYYFVAGDFLNGDPTTFNQPGNTGAVKLTVTTVEIGEHIQVIQEYISMDSADKGGQRRRWNGEWGGWQKY